MGDSFDVFPAGVIKKQGENMWIEILIDIKCFIPKFYFEIRC